MLYVINYANKKYRRAQILNSKTAKKVGKADVVIEYSEKDIDNDFYEKNKKILSYSKGNGYWLWKSYIVNKTLAKLEYGDYLMYCDSGAYFINDIHYLINSMEEYKHDIMCFKISTIEKEWTKRDAFIILDCDSKKYTDTNQNAGTFLVVKKTKNSEKVLKEWLEYAQDERMITDMKNQLGKDNYDGFREHRHDQSILSLLYKKNSYQSFRDPSQYGNDIKMDNSLYPQIVYLHRYGFVKTKLQEKVARLLLNSFLFKWRHPIKK